MRCFVAVDPSEAVRAAIARVQAELRATAPDADLRWVDPVVLHLTLKFLGEVDGTRQDAIARALAAAVAGTDPLALEVAGLGGFPSLRRPRVIWAAIGAGAVGLVRLASRVDAELAALGFAPEPRAFHPHLTLGRVRSDRGLAALAAAVGARARIELGAWRVRSVVLYRSHLGRGGAAYEPLVRVPLRGTVAPPDP